MDENLNDRSDDHKLDLPIDERMDPAGQSLARALQVSFRLLTLIMVGVLVAFVMTGMTCIESKQKGIKTFCGRIVGTAGEGPAYTWPFPIGWMEVVQTQGEQLSLTIDDFWMHETPQQKTQSLSERRVTGDGLQLGYDGAVLTGDQNLLHFRLRCNYTIDDVVAYVSHTADAGGTLRSVICQATIHAAAKRTADGLLRGDQLAFLAEIKRHAQRTLDAFDSGMRIKDLQLDSPTWPLAARAAYERYTDAISRAQSRKDQALSTARDILNATAGDKAVKLVGVPWRVADTADASYDLIGQYEAARRQLAAAERDGQSTRAVELRLRCDEKFQDIVQVLLASTGRVSALIGEARRYRSANTGRVRQWAERFAGYLPGYLESRELTRQDLWAKTRERILASPSVMKINLPIGKEATVLRISIPPDVLKEWEKQLKKLKAAEAAGARGEQ